MDIFSGVVNVFISTKKHLKTAQDIFPEDMYFFCGTYNYVFRCPVYSMSFCTIFTFVLQKMCFSMCLTFRCINGGKSNNNEDNSYACDMCIKAKPVSSEPAYRDIGYLKSMERTLEQEPPKLLVILQ